MEQTKPNPGNYVRQFLYRSLQFCLLALIVIFLVFAFRTIVDPYYRNQHLLNMSKAIFLMFTWPFEFFATQIQNSPGLLGFRIHPLWTTLGIVTNLLYLMILGNCLYYFIVTTFHLFKRFFKTAARPS